MFSVNPMAYMRAKVLMMDAGMAMAAISVERQLRRNTRTTKAARMAPTIRCSCTVFTESLMKSDWSRTIVHLVAARAVASAWRSTVS